MPNTFLKAKKLTHAYGAATLFSALSFDVPPGCILQVTGGNGSGKTTLLQLLAGIKSCQEGTIQRREEMLFVYIGHQNAVKAELSPLENLSLYEPDVRLCAGALAAFGLESAHHNRPCHGLSAGQQRKVALSRLHLADAKLWLLDEPFTALDDAAKMRVTQHLQKHAQNGGSAVVATHERLGVDKAFLKELVLS